MLTTKENRILLNNSPVTLKGVSLADVNHILGFRDFSVTEIIDLALANFKINTVRIPILPESKRNDSWYDTPDYFERCLKPAVDYALSKGLFVILDCHHICEFYKKPHFWNKNRDWNWNLKHNLMYFWDFLAKEYSDEGRVIFEIFNEPTGPNDWHRYKIKLANILITVIRNHSNNLVLVGFPSCSKLTDLLHDPVFHKNVAYSTHLYPKFLNSHWKENYEAIASKYPIVVVEWGFQSDEIIGGGTEYAEEVYSFLNKESISFISGFMDNKWEPSIIKDDLTLSDFGEFLKSKNL